MFRNYIMWICYVLNLYIFSVLGVICVNGEISNYTEYLIEKYPGYGTEFLFFPDKDGNLIKGYIDTNSGIRARAAGTEDIESSVSFMLYTRDVPGGTMIKTRLQLAKSSFKATRKTKFVTHGWLSSGFSDTCLTIKNAYLDQSDLNVIVFDWGKIADNVIYLVPMQSVPLIAKYVSEFFNYLIDNYDVNLEDVHFIGHSLGAHISGHAARRIRKGKIGRVTGLDPALPGFAKPATVPGGTLMKSDAQFVDVIHTCMGVLGVDYPIGHADFYPNGGCPPQPGCASVMAEVIEACSHGRSWQYFANSINDTMPFLAQHCQSYDDFVRGQNCYGDAIPMGDPVPESARGVYFLRTNLTWPIN